MDFIFMLTRNDQTVADCLEVLDLIAPVGLKHIGFKNVGVPPETLAKLREAIRELGATCYLEVVSETQEDILESLRVAREIKVDRVLGGTDASSALPVLDYPGAEYYPFPGRPVGHPTKLGGSEADVEKHCKAFMEMGCAGADLLAYRATEADPLGLIRAARRGLGTGRLIVAGSIDSPERIRAVADAGADAFTIGGAVFDSSFAPRKGSIRSQLQDVLDACGGS